VRGEHLVELLELGPELDIDVIARMVDDRRTPRSQADVEVVIPGLATYDALLSAELVSEVAA
jgi:hypothetical protein